MNARYDLNRAENCQQTGSPEAISPNGKYAIDLGEGRLAVREIASGERVAVLEKPEALLLAAASLSPDGKSIALVGERATGGERSLMLLQLESARFSASPLPPRDDSGEAIVWQDSGRPVVVGQRDAATSAAPDGAGATAPPAPAGASHRRLLATSDGVRRLEYDPATQSVEHVVLLDGVETREQLFQNVVAAGALPDAPMAWIATRNAGLYWIDRNDLYKGPSQAPVTYFLPDGKFFAQGKNAYDTNLPADTDLFRWAVDGDGLNSLGPQTYMRLSFEPQLIHKQIVCAQTPGCSGLRQSGTAQVNGALPEVAIETINAGSRPNTADVVIAVKQGQRTDSRGRTQTSGAFNLRLFRNGALVAQYPAVEESENPDVTAWRERNRVALGPDRTARIPLTISLPTAARPQDIELSAYAFNDDRVKSETSRIRFPVPAAAAPGPRRAFVVNIGIDDYDEKRLKLQFAASDARLLGSQLATIPGYTVHRVTLAGPAGRGGSVRVTAAMIAQAIGILAGRDVAASKNALKRQGVDASQLYASTPDDIVILSFSGHGWADETGAFYLVPAEGRWPGGPEPDRSTLISAVQMADRLREVDAAEMVMIIDACHSAASVDSGGFKPGPMGDPGLGQLAFDKGIRILAATQADDVAMEDPVLGQGLLTYALAGEGITATGGKADGDGDGRITLDEWLRYATRRMPSLGTDVRLGRLSTDASGARGWVRASAQNPPPIQEPSLFDFNTSPSKVVLRQGVGR
jgi:uncharacterized caspase-like protein